MSTRKSLKISLEIIIIFWICRLTTHLANVASCFPLCHSPKLPNFQPPLLQFLQASPNFQHHLVHSLQALPQVSPQLPPPTPQASPFPTTTSPISSGFPKFPTPPGPFPSGLTSGVSPTSTSHSPSFPISNHHFSNFFRLPQTSNTTWSIPFRPYLRCLPNFHLPLPKLPHFQPPLLQFLQASPNFQHHLVHSLQALPQVSPQLPPPTPQASPFPTTTSPISSGFPKLPTPPGQVSPQLPPPTPQASPFPTTTSPISSGFPKLPTPPGPFPSGLTSGVSPTSTSHSPSFPISNHHFSNFFRLPQTSNTTWSIPFRPYLRCLTNF